MAAPNIVNVTSIYGKTSSLSVVGTSASTLLSNASSSNKLMKVNSLTIPNIDGTNSATVTVTLRNAAGSTTWVHFCKTITVPPDTTLVLISKDTSVYLEEDRAIYVEASASGDLQAICSYEEIDDA